MVLLIYHTWMDYKYAERIMYSFILYVMYYVFLCVRFLWWGGGGGGRGEGKVYELLYKGLWTFIKCAI